MTDHNVVTIVIAIIEELRTQSTEVVRRLEEIPNLKAIIIRVANLALDEGSQKNPASECISLRSAWAHLPELSDADFAEAKRMWEPGPNE